MSSRDWHTLNSEYVIRMLIPIVIRSGNPEAAQLFVTLITKGEMGKFPKHLEKPTSRKSFQIAQAITKAVADSWVARGSEQGQNDCEEEEEEEQDCNISRLAGKNANCQTCNAIEGSSQMKVART